MYSYIAFDESAAHLRRIINDFEQEVVIIIP